MRGPKDSKSSTCTESAEVYTAGIVWLRLGVVLSYSRLLWLLGLYRTQTMAVVSAG